MKRTCRVCGREIEMFGWQQHVSKHKRDYCKVIGRFIGEAHNINFEDVVMYYNPKKANPKKCIGYEIPKKKTLMEYERK